MERSKKPSAIPVSPVIPTPQVAISEDNSRVTANLPTGESVEVLLHGATVISWKSAGGKENLFLSSKALLDGSKPVRGGVPLVFPVFGPPPPSPHPTNGLPQHGFARSSKWEYLGKSTSESGSIPNSSGDASVKLDFGLSNAMLDSIPSEWKTYAFGITYSVTLSARELSTSLLVRNTGDKTWDFQTLFHTYLSTDDISATTVHGLESSPYIDKIPTPKPASAANTPITFTSETDRVYSIPRPDPTTLTPVTVAVNKKPVFEIARDEMDDVVVWNPWDKKAGGMADFGPEGAWKKMVCVEVGAVGKWISLEGGDTWEGGQRIKLV